MRRRMGLAWAVAGGLATTPSYAQQLTPDELYDAGLTAMLAGDFAHGCPYLKQSVDAEPLPGAVFTLAECYAKWGKHASAIAEYQRYLQLYVSLSVDKRTKQKGRHRIASDQVAALEAIVPRITVSADGSPADAAALIDGRAVVVDEPVPVDPGTHQVTLTTPTGQDQTRSVDVDTGGAVTVSFAPDAPPLPAPAPVSQSGSSPWPLVGWIAIGLGGGAMVGGAITGGLALGQTGTVDDNCVDDRCNLTGLDAASKAQTLAQVSNVLFIAGGVVAAAGIVVVLVAPGQEDDAPSSARLELAPTGGNLRVTW